MFDIYNKDDKFGQVRKPFETIPVINEAEKEDNVEQKIFDFFKDNKNPPDEKIHGLAEKLKVNPHKFEAAIYKILSSFLSNGRFNESGKSENDFSKDELEMGIKVEQEHTNNLAMARRIALDHLAEFPDYYTRLMKMEDDAKKANESMVNELGGNVYDVIGKKRNIKRKISGIRQNIKRNW